jgi:16S rRNA (cytosine967-C5)-methyltransferase
VRLHRNVAEGVVSTLREIFEQRKVAERAVNATMLANPKWGSRDRSLFAELTYDIVRWRRLLAHVAGCQDSDIWGLLFAELARRDIEPRMIAELENQDSQMIRERLNGTHLARPIRESIPDWLDELGERELGAHWDAEIAALNGSAPVVLRANTLQITRDELQEALSAEGIETQTLDGLPDALQLQERRSLARQLKQGNFEVQDAASQLVAPFLRPEAGQTVVDACAGAGGKTLHLGALMGDEGRIIALDIEQRRLDELNRRTRVAGLNIVESHLAPSRTDVGLSSFADRLLIDAPCSGLGTLRRQPDLKWRLSPRFLSELQNKQRQILEFYSPTLKSGGLMVYATCSILPDENERQIEWFLGQHPEFELVEQRIILCSETGFDGFYMASLRKN